MSRPIRSGEALDGALLAARTGSRRWRASLLAASDASVVGCHGETTYRLDPQGWDVQPAQEHGRMNGGVRSIYRTEQELLLNGWRRIDV